MKLTTLADVTARSALGVADALAECLPAIRDAQAGQPGAQRYGMRHALGHYPDITGDAGIARASGDDPAANDEERVRRYIEKARRNLAEASHILRSYNSSVVINDRAGIGRCQDCNRYCDGKDRKLIMYRGKDPICDMCRKRRERASG